MEVIFGSRKIEKGISDPKKCAQKYGQSMGKIIHRRLNELKAASNLEIMRGIGDCHELHGKAKGCFAIDLEGKERMVFKINGNLNQFLENNSIVWGKIESVVITGVGDYH